MSGVIFALLVIVAVLAVPIDRVLIYSSLPYSRWRHRKLRSWAGRFSAHDAPLNEQVRQHNEWWDRRNSQCQIRKK